MPPAEGPPGVRRGAGAQLLWFGAYLTRQDEADLVQGWMLLLYNLAMIDAIVLPVSVATLASKSCELEHKGSTLKLLETMASPGSLYGAKLGLGAPWCWPDCWRSVRRFSWPWGWSWPFPAECPGGGSGSSPSSPGAVSMMVYVLQQGLSLRFANQAAAWSAASSGALPHHVHALSGLADPVRALGLLRPYGPGRHGLGRGHPLHPILLALAGARGPGPARAVGGVFLAVGRTLFVRKEV